MKVYEQIIPIGNGFDVSNHTFVNQIASGLQQKIETIVPKLEMIATGKKAVRGSVSMTLMGQIVLDETDDMDSVDNKIRNLVDSLKNPADLLSLLQ